MSGHHKTLLSAEKPCKLAYKPDSVTQVLPGGVDV